MYVREYARGMGLATEEDLEQERSRAMEAEAELERMRARCDGLAMALCALLSFVAGFAFGTCA